MGTVCTTRYISSVLWNVKNNLPDPVGPTFFRVIIIGNRLRLRNCAQITPILFNPSAPDKTKFLWVSRPPKYYKDSVWLKFELFGYVLRNTSPWQLLFQHGNLPNLVLSGADGLRSPSHLEYVTCITPIYTKCKKAHNYCSSVNKIYFLIILVEENGKVKIVMDYFMRLPQESKHPAYFKITKRKCCPNKTVTVLNSEYWSHFAVKENIKKHCYFKWVDFKCQLPKIVWRRGSLSALQTLFFF